MTNATDQSLDIVLDAPLTAREIMAIARGARLRLSSACEARIRAARDRVEIIVEREIRGYGINTGVGALCELTISREQQSRLSRNILFSHACGVGAPLSPEQARAVMAAQINNFAHGYSGLRPETVAALVSLLNAGVTPEIPSRGSVGYLTHAAAIGLVLIGHGSAYWHGQRVSGAQALAHAGLAPLSLVAKEGLSLVNGSPCATGLACLALDKAQRLLDWADAAAALSYGVLGRQHEAFTEASMRLRASPGLWESAQRLRAALEGTASGEASGRRTQDPLSLRAVPQVHGAVRDSLAWVAQTIEQELRSVTDNPLVAGESRAPRIYSQAHAVSTALAFALDQLAIIATQLGMIAERRTDRLLNPLVSQLPAFLASNSGVASGFMIAQYTASALCGENRRLSAPASLDGGITCALQEDVLPHSTPAASKALQVLDNLEIILGIELLCAAQAHACVPGITRSPSLEALYQRIRKRLAPYADDRPLNEDFGRITALLREKPFGINV